MANSKLDFIRQFFDTRGKRLSDSDKDLLYKILKDPGQYNGFTSQVFRENRSGKDYNGEWFTSIESQFRILFTDFGLKLMKVSELKCDDGYHSGSMDWKDAFEVTDIRSILDAFRQMGLE